MSRNTEDEIARELDSLFDGLDGEPMIDEKEAARLRTACLLDRVRKHEPTGLDAASQIVNEADATAYRVYRFWKHLQSSERENLAQQMGWPSADALRHFILNGAAPPGQAH